MQHYGYDYEVYTVETEDQWSLTLFRILGKIGIEADVTQKKGSSVLLQHGVTMDATTWLMRGKERPD